MTCDRPLIFVDLDDTLFQTAHKMPDGLPRIPVTTDIDGRPNGYMSKVQHMFLHWLLDCADVVPVTARSVEAYRRVRLPFVRGAICSHGGTLLGPEGSCDREWRMRMSRILQPFHDRLPALSEEVLLLGEALGYSLRSWVVAEDGLRHYAVTKHNESDDTLLADVLARVQSQGLLAGMWVHRNGNNLAFLPSGLSKQAAVQEWLRRDRSVRGERPVIGLGDSISDLGFMDLCHLWATPSGSQLAGVVEKLLCD